mmetsp:Transcript_60540/g.160121  ORF Transcript_60540/g.160121 Transcript_60540/m.160121 type:complete len:291 (+) Transcript_60540:251-1123(+)
MFSYEVVDDNLSQRGVNPAIREVRDTILQLGFVWPWAAKADPFESARAVLVGARMSFMAGDYDNIIVNVGPKSSQPHRSGKVGPPPKYEETEEKVHEWMQSPEMDGKSINRFNSLRKFVELDPTFCGHDELPIFTSTSTRSEKQNCIAAHEAWVKKASQAYYRYKKRFNYGDVAIVSAGPRGQYIPDNLEAEMDNFEARVLEARTLSDGSLILPEDVQAFDQTPLTREILARKTLSQRGDRRRCKIKTAGKEKERWTYTGTLLFFTAMGPSGAIELLGLSTVPRRRARTS